MLRAILPFVICWSSACGTAPTGLLATPDGDGPRVKIDWDARPLPEIPFPNDLASRPDPHSPTGLRLNLSELAPTEVERRARRKINETTGFGLYAPISVAFEAPLDLDEIVSRHRDDNHTEDDAFYLIDVTVGSPTFGQLAELDVGHGRFPLDVEQTDRYFPNDPLSDTPSLLFDTRDEDVNGNGLLDEREDIDGDGWLDVPNVLPIDGDPREDLLTWYERLTNTLIFRPVMPLREETTYAVVLTNRLIGEDGNPVLSPWDWVNHTRQTRALEPLVDLLPELGLALEDIAFAWTFTTGRITGDLVDIRLGLDGEGPFKSLQDEFPAGVNEALALHDMLTVEDPHRLPVSTLINVLASMDLFSDDSAEILQDTFTEWGEHVVGGSFETPYFLADRDDNGFDDSDEWWQVDSVTGTYSAAPQRIPFTCVSPKPTPEYEAPFSVVILGHGYGSSRFEAFSFMPALLQAGFAACTMDYPGHGPSISPDDMEEFDSVLRPLGLLPFVDHLLDSRMRDLDNDGRGESGGDQWIADGFHTRDMVRQAAVDTAQFIRTLQACGDGSMNTSDGSTAVSCDWDGDGSHDLGGPDADYFLVGGSLGGINTAVSAAVEPELSASVSIVPGGGLMDVAARSPLSGVVEAVPGRLMSPLILGYPAEDGGLRITQMVTQVMDMAEYTIQTLPTLPAGGRVRVENLDNGEMREGLILDDGTFRVGIPADAPSAFEKREITGMPLEGPDLSATYGSEDNQELGDLLEITIWDQHGGRVAVLNTFGAAVVHEAVTYEEGSPLVALSEGLGHVRATPDYRRLVMAIALVTEPGDPIAYAPHLYEDPFEALGGQPANHIVMPTPGDMIVAINSGIALARAAGLVERHEPDPLYGTTVDRWLIDTEVVRGLEEHGPWTNDAGTPVLFDADDLDNGTDGLGAPSDAPLRIVLETTSGVSGLRLPYVSTAGAHGFSLPNPSLDFDINSFSINQVARYFQTRGQELIDDPCLATWDCEFMRPLGAQ
ncbi:MAG: hypothetical protein VX519_02720 [Myxococcota bacterium]|nr:hypothetical protein [Myxococcota bacterium]